MSRILIVEDDAPVARLLSLILKQEGHETVWAANGAFALRAIEDDRPDVIVLDLQMPVLDGRQFFKEIDKRPNRPPVLILSAFSALRARRELGAEAAIDKPFAPETFLESIRRLLRGRVIEEAGESLGEPTAT